MDTETCFAVIAWELDMLPEDVGMRLFCKRCFDLK